MKQSERPTAMRTCQHRASNWLAWWMPAKFGTMLVVALAASMPATAAYAHSFSLAVVAGGEQATMPDQSAIEGYNAARRIDLAVRTLGGVDDRRALIEALAATKDGIDW